LDLHLYGSYSGGLIAYIKWKFSSKLSCKCYKPEDTKADILDACGKFNCCWADATTACERKVMWYGDTIYAI
jgi:hypothetical protein